MPGENTFVKAEQVVALALGLLERETILSGLVWRDAVGDFAGAKDDTINVRLPAYSKARERGLRSGDQREKDSLHQRKIALKLTTDFYNDIPITDEEMTLDIANFGTDIIAPVLAGHVRANDDKVASLMTDADYAVTIDWNPDDPHASLVDAGLALNNANVPVQGRGFVCGSAVAGAILKSDQMRRADSAGAAASSALQEATIARIAGFTVVPSAGLPPDFGVAFHRSAFVLSTRAPIVPAGAPWGATMSAGGFSIRCVRVFDPDQVEDRIVVDSWAGADVVGDAGDFDDNGVFEPAVEPDPAGSDVKLVRAVKVGSGSGDSTSGGEPEGNP